MTRPTMTCGQFADHLADLLERDANDATRAEMEAHALDCDACGALLADLRTLRINAANLAPLAPSRDLWAGIAARIETPVVSLNAETLHAERGTLNVKRRGMWIGFVAAAALVGVTATVTHEMTKRSLGGTVVGGPSSVVGSSAPSATDRPPTTDHDTTGHRPQSTDHRPPTTDHRPTKLASNPETAIEKTYGDEIARLHRVVQEERPELDSATVAVLDKNLKIIDGAIAQCRVALGKDPHSRYIIESLNDALGTKVQLLRTVTLLSPRA